MPKKKKQNKVAGKATGYTNQQKASFKKDLALLKRKKLELIAEIARVDELEGDAQRTHPDDWASPLYEGQWISLLVLSVDGSEILALLDVGLGVEHYINTCWSFFREMEQHLALREEFLRTRKKKNRRTSRDKKESEIKNRKLFFYKYYMEDSGRHYLNACKRAAEDLDVSAKTIKRAVGSKAGVDKSLNQPK